MNIKKVYNYFFYKIYKSIEYTSGESDGKNMIIFKVGLVIIFLEILSIVSLLIYYNLYFNPAFNIIGTEIQWIIMVILLVLIDYFIFHNNTSKWQELFIQFDKLPKKKNTLGSWAVFGIIFFIIINFVLAFYLYYQS